MRLTLGKRARCLLAWLAVLAIPALVVVGLLMPWQQRLAELDGEIATLTDKVQRSHNLLATLPTLRAELDAVRDNQEIKAFYFEAATPALAGAEVQRVIQQIVDSAGGQTTSTQILPASPTEHPPKVRVRSQLQATTDALRDILHGVEQARPFLFVDQLSVRSTARTTPDNPRARAAAARRPALTARAGYLTVRLDVFGYTLGPEAAEEPEAKPEKSRPKARARPGGRQ